MTPADELRELLVRCEKRVANLKGSGADAVELLLDMDRIDELWPALEAQGMDLRPESGRWDTIQRQVQRNGSRLLRELWTVGGMDQVRAREHAGETELSWWWQLDDLVRRETQARVRRTALTVAAIVVVGVALWFIFNALFPVDPQVQAALSAQTAGEQKIVTTGDWAGALEDFRTAAQHTPDDATAWIRVGVALEQIGDKKAAEENYDKARALSKDENAFLLARAGVYVPLGINEPAMADLQAVLATDPENAVAYYYLGSAYEGLGDTEQAIDALQKASDFATQSNQSELVALARYRMAMLMQSSGVGSLRGDEPTPTPTPTPGP